MADRSQDWFAQAERDLHVARAAARDGYHEWACFAAQQAAGNALKAANLSHLRESRTHVLTQLLEDLGVAVPEIVKDQARVLETYYIPTRHANGHEKGAPFTHYGALQGGQAIEYAGVLIELARSHMAESR